MESFYSIVVVVAIVFLILCLVMVGITLQSQQGNKPVFPKLQNACPDRWTSSGTACVLNSSNAGDPANKITAVVKGTHSEHVWDSSDLANFKPKEGATVCDKRKWAISNSIQWDGVSNYNQCT